MGSSFRAVRLAAVGAYRPGAAVGNEAFTAIGSSDAWVRKNTGIVTRYRAGAGETIVDMAATAGEEALDGAGVAPADVGLVLLATSSNPRQTPGLAPELASRLGLRAAGASDVAAGCAGFGYALAFAGHAITAGSAQAALVVGAEKMSDGVDHSDRRTAPLFGDGAGAAVVVAAEEPGIGPVIWGSDGDRHSLIGMSRTWREFVDDPDGGRPYLRMEGAAVMRWAVRELVPVARRACHAAGVNPRDVRAFVPNQSNLPLVRFLAKSFGLAADAVVAEDVTHSANTSAASVPLALHRLVTERSVPTGAPALILSFGAGLAYAAQVISVP